MRSGSKPGLPASALVALSIGLAAATHASAALVTLSGSNFDVVYDDAQAGLAVYGSPVVSWNTIFFMPTDFTAESLNGTGPVTTAASITLELIAKPTVAFSQLFMSERGDYRLIGDRSSVSVSGSIQATNVGAGTDSAALSISPTRLLSIADGGLHPWLGTASLTAHSGSPLGVAPTALTVVLSSSLFAETLDPESVAFIQQKFAGGRVELQVRPAGEVTPVPLPGGVVLAAAGLTGLGTFVRRRRLASDQRGDRPV